METNGIYDAIVEASIATSAESSVYEALRDSAIGLQVDDWIAVLRIDEYNWMNDKFGDEPDSRKWEVEKNGKTRMVNGQKGIDSAFNKGWALTGNSEFKYRSYLPNPYTSAKTVVKKALEHGIDVTGLGKSELTKLTKEEASKTTEPPSAWEKVQKAMRFIDSNKQGLSLNETIELEEWAQTV